MGILKRWYRRVFPHRSDEYRTLNEAVEHNQGVTLEIVGYNVIAGPLFIREPHTRLIGVGCTFIDTVKGFNDCMIQVGDVRHVEIRNMTLKHNTHPHRSHYCRVESIRTDKPPRIGMLW